MTPEIAAIIVASISAIASIVAAAISLHNSGKLTTIKVLVNGKVEALVKALLAKELETKETLGK